ncbi:hypothetical protein HK104_001999, partial [Borealophlyctis nickersoniae]
MYDIDMTLASRYIPALHARNIKVICYFSAGSYENYRSDAHLFPPSALGAVLDGWPDERWIDTSNPTVRSIMKSRMEYAKQIGCDGVDPDNVDGYSNTYKASDTTFTLTYATQLEYNKWIATTAHSLGLTVLLKNNLAQVKELEPYFDGAVNEQCVDYKECEYLLPFVKAGKAVFGVEYNWSEATSGSMCGVATGLGFDWLLKDLDLGP